MPLWPLACSTAQLRWTGWCSCACSAQGGGAGAAARLCRREAVAGGLGGGLAGEPGHLRRRRGLLDPAHLVAAPNLPRSYAVKVNPGKQGAPGPGGEGGAGGRAGPRRGESQALKCVHNFRFNTARAACQLVKLTTGGGSTPMGLPSMGGPSARKGCSGLTVAVPAACCRPKEAISACYKPAEERAKARYNSAGRVPAQAMGRPCPPLLTFNSLLWSRRDHRLLSASGPRCKPLRLGPPLLLEGQEPQWPLRQTPRCWRRRCGMCAPPVVLPALCACCPCVAFCMAGHDSQAKDHRRRAGALISGSAAWRGGRWRLGDCCQFLLRLDALRVFPKDSQPACASRQAQAAL